MDLETRLLERLGVYESMIRQGQRVSAEELCRDCPDLLEEVKARIHDLESLHSLLDTNVDEPRPGSASALHFLAPAQAKDELGRLGGFRILKVLGHGGMGIVFAGHDPKLGRQVAIKAMLPHLASNRAAQQRFLREARAAAAVQHDHIVPIFHVDEERGAPFIVMPLLQGESLEKHLQRDAKLSLIDVLRIGREIALGLDAAHAKGLIHRDIKPANIWLEAPRRRVKLLDFGLARASAQDAGLTQQGMIIGTPSYMAPEQARGEKVDARCDLWSLGVVLYRLCTGKLPFRGNDTVSTLLAVANTVPSPPVEINAKVPAGLSDLAMRLLEKDPARRLASARKVAEALRKLEQAEHARAKAAERAEKTLVVKPSATVQRPVVSVPAPKRRRTAYLLALGGVAAVLLLAFVLTRPRSDVDRPQETSNRDVPQVAPQKLQSAPAPLLAMNGLAGLKSLEPELYPAAWRKEGVFAEVKGAGEIRFPTVPVCWYVIETEVELHRVEGHVYFRQTGAGAAGTEVEVARNDGHPQVKKDLACGLWVSDGAHGWGGRLPVFNVGERVNIKLAVGDRAAILYCKDSLYGVTSRPANLTFRIQSTPNTSATIHRCSVRELREGDLPPANRGIRPWPMPRSALPLQPSKTAERLKQAMAGLDSRPRENAAFVPGTTGMPLAWIAPGEFFMGAQKPLGEERKHQVRLTRGFWMGQYEVTQLEWTRLVGTDPSRVKGSPYLPIDWVSWEDAMTFCSRLTDQERKAGRVPAGYVYRLPTSAEWEYACRAGSQDLFSAADFWCVENSGERFHEVGEKAPNAWGLHDMHGNVAEWTLDRWYDYPKQDTDIQVDPVHLGQPARDAFILRGGAWISDRMSCRSPGRERSISTPSGYCGFRVVLGPSEKLAPQFLIDLPERRRQSLEFERDPKMPVGGKSTPKDLLLHPPTKGFALVAYGIGQRYSRFQATVGVSDLANSGRGSETALRFKVLGDGKALWQSRLLQKPGEIEHIDVAVDGIAELTLQVICDGPSFCAHAVWVEPRLLPANKEK